MHHVLNCKDLREMKEAVWCFVLIRQCHRFTRPVLKAASQVDFSSFDCRCGGVENSGASAALWAIFKQNRPLLAVKVCIFPCSRKTHEPESVTTWLQKLLIRSVYFFCVYEIWNLINLCLFYVMKHKSTQWKKTRNEQVFMGTTTLNTVIDHQ